MRLSGKTALITGGNGGIGLATARLFVSEGAQVVITGRNAARLTAALSELGSEAITVNADASEEGAAERCVAATIERFGKLDIVFANAGISKQTPVGSTGIDVFDQVLRTNVTAAFLTVQAAVPHLKPGSAIILNGSVQASLGTPMASAYAASKAGVRAMARVLASELAPLGIRVNVVTPGATRTTIWANRAPTPEAFANLEARLSKSIPSGRFSEASEIADAVLFLACADSRNVNATEIVVDGGHTGAPMGAPVCRT